jgi:hypothetical protein
MFLTYYFLSPQVKNKPHDGATIRAFILDPGMVTINELLRNESKAFELVLEK